MTREKDVMRDELLKKNKQLTFKFPPLKLALFIHVIFSCSRRTEGWKLPWRFNRSSLDSALKLCSIKLPDTSGPAITKFLREGFRGKLITFRLLDGVIQPYFLSIKGVALAEFLDEHGGFSLAHKLGFKKFPSAREQLVLIAIQQEFLYCWNRSWITRRDLELSERAAEYCTGFCLASALASLTEQGYLRELKGFEGGQLKSGKTCSVFSITERGTALLKFIKEQTEGDSND